MLSKRESDLKFINDPNNNAIYDTYNKGFNVRDKHGILDIDASRNARNKFMKEHGTTIDNFRNATDRLISQDAYGGYNRNLKQELVERNDSFKESLNYSKESAQEFRNRALKDQQNRLQQAADEKIAAERAAKKRSQQEAFEKSQREYKAKRERFKNSPTGKALTWIKNNPKTVKRIGIGALGVGAAGIGYSIYKHNKNKNRENKDKQ